VIAGRLMVLKSMQIVRFIIMDHPVANKVPTRFPLRETAQRV
jgi:hypothetical protein